MIAPEIKNLISQPHWYGPFEVNKNDVFKRYGNSVDSTDIPEIKEIVKNQSQYSAHELISLLAAHSSIPTVDLARILYDKDPSISSSADHQNIFHKMSKQDYDQLASENRAHYWSGGLIRFSNTPMAQSPDYMTKSVIKSIVDLMKNKESNPSGSHSSVSDLVNGLDQLFNGRGGFAPITEQHKDEIANTIVDYMKKHGASGENKSNLSPIYAHLLRKSPNTIEKMHGNLHLPRLNLTQDLLDATLEAAKSGTLTPEKANWLLNRSSNNNESLDMRGGGDVLFDLLQNGGFDGAGVFNLKNHKVPFQKLKPYLDKLHWSPKTKAKILSGAKISPHEDDEVIRYFGILDGLIEHDGMSPDRTGLTDVIERAAQKRGGLGNAIPLNANYPQKYNLSEQDLHQFVQRFANPIHLQSLNNDKNGSNRIKSILKIGSLPPSLVKELLHSLSKNIKTKGYKVEGSIKYGANLFADRSLSSEGHYTGDDPSLHPNDVLDVRVGSSVLRKLRDHLEKAGQIRPEDLPKGESWNSILKPITDKSGNVNYIPDWNPLRSANGKLDSAKVQQYIDSMPARRFVLSYSTWTYPRQRHSKAKSNVLIANLSPDTIEKLKQENLYGKFLESTVSDVDTIHPLGRDSIGWIRFTGDHKKGFHVDEVQSDLYGDLRKSTDPDHKRIAEIVFGDAHPSEILHEVAQEYFRKNPKNIGAPWATHTVASKSPMALEEAKEAPVHFKVSYEQAPKRMGAKPSTYGTLRTQTGDNPKYAAKYALQGKPTWQDEVRKFEEVEGEDLLVKATAKKPKTPAPEASPSVQEEPKDLVVLHNLREAGLHHADEIGGLPAPSIAVAKVDHPLTNFGDVSLVGHHSMIDPKDTPVFDADVYSPRWPRVGHTLDSKKLTQFHREMEPLTKEIDGRGIDESEIERHGEGAIDSSGIKYPLAVAFLREQGHEFQPIVEKLSPPSGMEFLDTPIIHQFFKENQLPSDRYEWAQKPELAAKLKEIMPTAIEQSFQLHNPELDREARDFLRSLANEKIAKFNKHYTADESQGVGGLHLNFLWHVSGSYPKIGAVKPASYENEKLLNQKIEEIGKDKFSEWAKSKIRPLIKDKHIIRFTKSGTKKKLPYTLVNLLNELTSTIRGGEGFNYGLGTARSHGATQFQDLTHMANSRYRIVSKEDFQKQKKDMDNRFDAITDLVSKSASSTPGFRVMGGLAEAIGSYYRNKQMGRSLSSAGFSGVPASVVNQIKQFADDLRSMPTEYFEAKPQRIVNLSEFKGAAVPHDASEKTLEILRRNGINHIERYDRHDEDARREAIRRIAQGNDLLLNETEYANLIKSFAKNEVKKAFKHEVSEGILSQSKQLVKSEDRKMVIRKAIVTTFQKLQKAIAKQMLYPEKDPVVLDDLLRIKTLGHKTPEHALDSFVQHEEPEVRISAIHELPLKDHHLHTLVHDADPEVAKQAVRSSKAQEAHLLAALERPDHDLHALVAMHPNATENTLHKVLDGEHPLDVKLAAVQNPKNDLPALMGAARRYTEATDDSPEAEILTEILSHPHADQPLYQSVLHGNFPSTAKAIAASKLIDDTHLANALTHPDELVALGAVASPKARSGHYHHANSDSVKKAIAMKFGGAV